MIAPPERIVVVNGFGQASRLLAEVLAGRGIHEIGLEEGAAVRRAQAGFDELQRKRREPQDRREQQAVVEQARKTPRQRREGC